MTATGFDGCVTSLLFFSAFCDHIIINCRNCPVDGQHNFLPRLVNTQSEDKPRNDHPSRNTPSNEYVVVELPCFPFSAPEVKLLG